MSLLKLSRSLIVSLAALHCAALTAHAAVTFSVSYDIGGAPAASGQITATAFGGGIYVAESISGTWNGIAIDSLLNPGDFYGDNFLFYPPLGSVAHLTGDGLSFSAGGTLVNVYYDGDYNQEDDQGGYELLGNFLLTPVGITPVSVLSFAYAGDGVSASGLLYVTDIGGGEYGITGISGQRNGSPITGLVPQYDYSGLNDNLVYYPLEPYLSDGGFAFYVDGESYNIFACGCFEYTEEGPGGLQTTLSSFALQPVPEPAFWPAAALACGGVAIRRRYARK